MGIYCEFIFGSNLSFESLHILNLYPYFHNHQHQSRSFEGVVCHWSGNKSGRVQVSFFQATTHQIHNTSQHATLWNIHITVKKVLLENMLSMWIWSDKKACSIKTCNTLQKLSEKNLFVKMYEVCESDRIAVEKNAPIKHSKYVKWSDKKAWSIKTCKAYENDQKQSLSVKTCQVCESDRIAVEKNTPWKHAKYVNIIGQKTYSFKTCKTHENYQKQNPWRRAKCVKVIGLVSKKVLRENMLSKSKRSDKKACSMKTYKTLENDQKKSLSVKMYEVCESDRITV